MRRSRARGLVVAALMAAAGQGAHAADTDAEARAILKAMSDWMAAQETLAFRFDSGLEVITPALEKIAFTSSGDALLQRPDRLRARRSGGYVDVELFFDGSTIGIVDHATSDFARVEAPGDIDALVETLRTGLGVALPAADLLLSDAHGALIDGVIEAKHIGRGVIGGRDCEHLAFRGVDTDWQLWVEVGDRPAPCRIVITTKTLAAAPQYTVTVMDLRTDVEIAADAFALAPPAGGRELAVDALPHLDELPVEASAEDRP